MEERAGVKGAEEVVVVVLVEDAEEREGERSRSVAAREADIVVVVSR